MDTARPPPAIFTAPTGAASLVSEDCPTKYEVERRAARAAGVKPIVRRRPPESVDEDRQLRDEAGSWHGFTATWETGRAGRGPCNSFTV